MFARNIVHEILTLMTAMGIVARDYVLCLFKWSSEYVCPASVAERALGLYWAGGRVFISIVSVSLSLWKGVNIVDAVNTYPFSK